MLEENINPIQSPISFDPEAFKQEILNTVQATLNSHSVSVRKAVKQPLDNPNTLSEAALQTQIQELKELVEAKDKATKDLSRRATISKFVNDTINPEAATKLLDEAISKYAEVDANGNIYINKDGKVEDLKTYTSKWLDTEGSWLKSGTKVKTISDDVTASKPIKTTPKKTTLTDILNKAGV
jgi:hypothetical protein